jgi:RNA polymerase sigma factor (sigma-70 family)
VSVAIHVATRSARGETSDLQVRAGRRPYTSVVQDAAVRVSVDRFESVFREEGARLYRALYAFAGDREVASDALGEAFAQAIARGDAIRDPAAWLWKVAFLLARAELKQRPALHDPHHDETYEMPDPLPHLFEALSRISPNERLAVVLHDYADRPTDEIARILGASRATVYVHLSQGRRKLRDLLETNDE